MYQECTLPVTCICGTVHTSLSLFVTLSHDSLNRYSVIAIICLSVWVIAIAFIQNPKNGMATVIVGTFSENEEESRLVGASESINSANLYFFSWLTFLTTVYISGVTFQDNFRFGPKFSQWVLLLTASVILMSTSISIREDICSNTDLTCERTQYAVAVGAIGTVISFLSVVASVMDVMGRVTEIAATVLSTILYFFGVIFLTSASGPASALGNMYFSVWGGCVVSFVLLVGVIFPKSSESSTAQHSANANNIQEEEENI
jgi:hypothetical protein